MQCEFFGRRHLFDLFQFLLQLLFYSGALQHVGLILIYIFLDKMRFSSFTQYFVIKKIPACCFQLLHHTIRGFVQFFFLFWLVVPMAYIVVFFKKIALRIISIIFLFSDLLVSIVSFVNFSSSFPQFTRLLLFQLLELTAYLLAR